MGWKPKEKQLTPEEAIEAARRDLAPFWIGSPPLLAGVRGADGKATAHPLDPAFEKRSWLILFAGLLGFGGEVVLLYAHEWLRRYVTGELGLLLVVRPQFTFLKSGDDLKAILKKSAGAYPVVLDHESLITEAFGSAHQVLPSVKLLHQRKILFERSGPEWERSAENEIQGFLRLKDPGLPLAPPFDLRATVPHDSAMAEFGSRAPSALCKITGKTRREVDHVFIQDPAATVRFSSPHARVSIVMQAAVPKNGISRVRIELNGDTVYEAVTAKDLSYGDDGGSEVKVTEGRLYHLLHSLPPRTREITLRFPDSDRLPVALYCVCFSAL